MHCVVVPAEASIAGDSESPPLTLRAARHWLVSRGFWQSDTSNEPILVIDRISQL